MSLLTCTGVTLRMGGRTLLDGADLAVDAGRRIGLVGRNGAGKSTLLKAIAGDITVDGGDIRLSSRARMAQVRQEAPSGPAILLDTVLEGDPERLTLLAEAERAEHAELIRRVKILAVERGVSASSLQEATIKFLARGNVARVQD